jgi:hypothetical protein
MTHVTDIISFLFFRNLSMNHIGKESMSIHLLRKFDWIIGENDV